MDLWLIFNPRLAIFSGFRFFFNFRSTPVVYQITYLFAALSLQDGIIFGNNFK